MSKDAMINPMATAANTEIAQSNDGHSLGGKITGVNFKPSHHNAQEKRLMDLPSYSEADIASTKSHHPNWDGLNWFEQQRALAYDKWVSDEYMAVDTPDQFFDGLMNNPHIEAINKREKQFNEALRDAYSVDISAIDDAHAQALYMNLVQADPHFGFDDDIDGRKVFGAEAGTGRENLNRLMNVYKGVNPNGLLSQEAQIWMNLSKAQKYFNAKKENSAIKEMFYGGSHEDAIRIRENEIMEKQDAVQFASLMASLSPRGQQIVLDGLKNDGIDSRSFNLIDKNEEDVVLAAYRSASPYVDANWWLTIGACQFGEGAASMVGGVFRSLRNVGGKIGMMAGTQEYEKYEQEALRQLKLREAMQNKYKTDELSFLGQVASGVMGTIPYMAAMSNPYTGTLAVIGMCNDARERMVLSGVDADLATIISIPVGVIEGLIEKIQWESFIGKGLTDLTVRQNSIVALFKKTIARDWRAARSILMTQSRAGAIEYLTQTTEEILQDMVETIGVQIGTGDYDVRELVEGAYETFVESSPATAGFGIIRASGIAPLLHRKYSRRASIAADINEYRQGLNMANNIIAEQEKRMRGKFANTQAATSAVDGGAMPNNTNEGIKQEQSDKGAQANQEQTTPNANPLSATAENAQKQNETKANDANPNATDNQETQADGSSEDGHMSLLGRVSGALQALRSKWYNARTTKEKMAVLHKAGFSADQVALLDKFFRMDEAFAQGNDLYQTLTGMDNYSNSGKEGFNIVDDLPKRMRAVKNVVRNDDGSYSVKLQIAKGIVVDVNVRWDSRKAMQDRQGKRFVDQVRDLYDKNAGTQGAFDALSEEDRKHILNQHAAKALTEVAKKGAKIKIDGHEFDYDALVYLASPEGLKFDGADMSHAAHEIFHVATLVAQNKGLLTDEDIAKLRKVYGDPKAEGEMFDEESAANAYGEFISGKIDDKTGLFQKIREFFQRILNLLRHKGWNTNREVAEYADIGSELTAENVFKLIQRGDLPGISALSGIEVETNGNAAADEAQATAESKANNQTNAHDAKPHTESKQRTMMTVATEIPGVGKAYASIEEVSVDNLLVPGDEGYSPELAQFENVVTSEVMGAPIVVGGGHVLAGANKVLDARKRGEKTIRVRRIRKVKLEENETIGSAIKKLDETIGDMRGPKSRFALSVGDRLDTKDKYDAFVKILSIRSKAPAEPLADDVTPQGAAQFYKENILGRTLTMPNGEKLEMKEGHFFRITCTKIGKTKGFVEGYSSGSEAFQAILRGEVPAEKINGYEQDRVIMMPMFSDVVENPMATLKNDKDVSQSVKRYETKDGRAMSAVFRVLDGGRKILSYHGFGSRYGELKHYRITHLSDAAKVGIGPTTAVIHGIGRAADISIAQSGPDGQGDVSNSIFSTVAQAQQVYDDVARVDALEELRLVETHRVASSYAEARTVLAPQVGKTFRNKDTGVEATLSNNSVNKLLSGKAVAKSVGVKEHLAAVANVTDLFENGRLLATDEGARKGVLSAKRFLSRFNYNGEDLVAKTTVLEYEQGDHRIYSVEAMEVKKAGSILAPKGSTNQAESPALPSTSHIIPHPGPSAQGGDSRFSIGGLYTGSAADYEKPSLHYVGTGEGTQVYGWGLYASDRRGVAESYANSGVPSGRNLPFMRIISDNGTTRNGRGITPDSVKEEAYADKNEYWSDLIAASTDNPIDARRDVKKYGVGVQKYFNEHFHEYKFKYDSTPGAHIYEQTFFTNREPGDESHLLNWYEPLSEWQNNLIEDALSKNGVTIRRVTSGPAYNRGTYYEKDGNILVMTTDQNAKLTGQLAYQLLAKYEVLGSPKAASEWLAAHDIDGVKYPVDSYGKTVKDGDKVGWNYVSFRDDNISVDHKWTDGQIRFSIVKDVDTIKRLEDEVARGEHIVTYRAVEAIPGVGLVPPMASIDDGDYNDVANVGDWIKPDINFLDLINVDGKHPNQLPIRYRVTNEYTGKSKVQTTWVAPNAYVHSSLNPFNDQFKAAHNRPNMVVVRMIVPNSAATGEKSDPRNTDSPGFKDWNAGPVAKQMERLGKPRRKVMLSTYAKIDKILSPSEVVDLLDDMTDGIKDQVTIPYEVVPPSLRKELLARDYKIFKDGTRYFDGDVSEGANPISRLSVSDTAPAASITDEDELDNAPSEANMAKELKTPFSLPLESGFAYDGVDNGTISRFSVKAGIEGVGCGVEYDEVSGNVTVWHPDMKRKVTKEDPLTVDEIMESQSAFTELMGLAKRNISGGDARKLAALYADIINTSIAYIQDNGGNIHFLNAVWKWAGSEVFKSVKPNGDAQYSLSIDMTTICKKTEQFLNVVSAFQVMNKRGTTPAEMISLYLETGNGVEYDKNGKVIVDEKGIPVHGSPIAVRAEHFQTPCPCCYVFSHWIRTGLLLETAYMAQRRFAKELKVVEEVRAIRLERDKYNKNSPEWKALDAKYDEASRAAAVEMKKLLKQEQDWQETHTKNKKGGGAKGIDEAKKTMDAAGALLDTTARTLLVETNKPAEERDEKKIATLKKKVERISKIITDCYRLIAQSDYRGWLKSTVIRDMNAAKIYDDYVECPPDILFAFNRADELVLNYPSMARFRSSKGSAGGKAIETDANNEFGEVISGLAGMKKDGKPYNPFAVGDKKGMKKAFDKACLFAIRQRLRGGQRIFSWSDNLLKFGPDMFWNFLQLQAVGASVQSYSKQLEGVELICAMGGYNNGSLIAYGKGFEECEPDAKAGWDKKKGFYRSSPVKSPKDGKWYQLCYSRVQGINAEKLFELNNTYDRSGNIIVGMNEDHIILNLGHHGIFFCIPWHASGLKEEFLEKMMELLNEPLSGEKSQDHTKVQSDGILKEPKMPQPLAPNATAEEERDYNDDMKKYKERLAEWNEGASKRYEITDFWNEIGGLYSKADRFGKELPSCFDVTIVRGGLSESQKRYAELRSRILLGQATAEDINLARKDVFLSQVIQKLQRAAVDLENSIGSSSSDVCEVKVGDETVRMLIMQKADAESIYPYEYWDETSHYYHLDPKTGEYVGDSTADCNGDRYLEYCRRMGAVPKFCGFQKNGTRLRATKRNAALYHKKPGDVLMDYHTFEGYFKSLIDRRMYAIDGTYQDTTPVTAHTMNMEHIRIEDLRRKWVDEKGRSLITTVADKTAAEPIARMVTYNNQKLGLNYNETDIGEDHTEAFNNADRASREWQKIIRENIAAAKANNKVNAVTLQAEENRKVKQLGMTPGSSNKVSNSRFAIGPQMKDAVAKFTNGQDAELNTSIGKVLFSFGRPGVITEQGRIRHGEGFLHVIYSRIAKDRMSLEDAILTAIRVGDAVENGAIFKRTRNRIIFHRNEYEAVVAKNYNGNLVVTGYKIETDVSSDDKLVSPELRTTSAPRKEEVVAALKRILPKIGLESQTPVESRHAISLMGDPHDLITAIAATRKRSGRTVTEEEVASLLKGVGGDPNRANEVLKQSKELVERTNQTIKNLIGTEAISDDEFFKIARTTSEQMRLLNMSERIGTFGYNLGTRDERRAQKIAERREQIAKNMMAAAEGFKADEMETKYGFDIVDSVANSARAKKVKRNEPVDPQDKPGEINGPGKPIDGEEAPAPEGPTPVEAPESAQVAALKEKATKRADEIDAKYGLHGGTSPIQEKQNKANEAANQEQAKEASTGADDDTSHSDSESVVEGTEEFIKREALDLNRASDFLAFIETVVEQELRDRGSIREGEGPFDDPVNCRELVNTARHWLKKIAMSLCASTGRELILKDIESMDKATTLQAIECAVMNVYSLVQERLITQTQNELIRKLEREGKKIAEKGKRYKRIGDERDRKVRAEVELWWRNIKRYFRLTDEEIQAELEELDKILDEREKVLETDKTYDIRNDLEWQRATDLKNALTQYGGLINKRPAQIEEIANDILDQLAGSREELENAREERRIAMQKISMRIQKAMVNPIAQAKNKKPDPGWAARMFDSMMGVLHVRLRDLIRFSRGDIRSAAEVDLQGIEDAIALASQGYNVYCIQQEQALSQFMTEHYGSPSEGIRRLTEVLDDEDRKVLTKQGVGEMTRAWLLQRYVELLQTNDYAVNIEVNKRNGKWREDFDRIFAKYISSDDLKLVAWMRDWYRQNLDQINNEVLIPISGIKQYSPGENYFPVKMKTKERKGFGASAKSWSPYPNWLAPRVRHQLDFDETTDILTMWYKRMREGGVAINYAKLGVNLSDIFMRPDMKKVIKDNHGDIAFKRLQEHLMDIVSGGAKDIVESDDSLALADRLRAWQTNLTLSCNYISAFKQMLSCPVYALRHDINFGMVMKFMADIDIASIRELMASPGWTSRYGNGYSEAIQNAMRVNAKSGGKAGLAAIISSIYNAGFKVMEIGDAVPCLWVGQGLYRYNLAKLRDEAGNNASMSEEELKQLAMTRTWAIIEMTQQSKRIENLTAAQRGGSLGRLLYQFVSSPVQQLSYEVQIIKEAYSQAKAYGGWHKVDPETKKHLYRTLVVNHILMPNLLNLGAMIAALPLGAIPDKDEIITGILLSTIIGQYGCIFMAGAVGEGTINALLTGKYDYRSQGLPVTGIADLFAKLGVTAHDLLTLDVEGLKKDVIKLIQSSGAPGRQAVRAYRNYAEGANEKAINSWK